MPDDTPHATVLAPLGPLEAAARAAAEDASGLDAGYPVAFLPVRVETRFGTDDGAPCLRVRVYPDEIMADGHEPELTADENAAGQTFWQRGWQPADAATAWQALLARYPAPRAAWIALTTTPTNLAARPDAPPVFPNVALRASSWTRPVETRVLPDRWIVKCFRGGVEVRAAVGTPIPDPLPLTVSPALAGDDPARVVDISGDGLLMDRAVLWTVDFAAAIAVGMGVTVRGLDAADLAQGFDRVLVYGVKASLAAAEAGARLTALLDAHHYGRGLAFVPQGTPTNNTSDATSGFPPLDPNGAVSFAVERGPALTADGSDGRAFAAALGVAAAAVDHVAGADRGEQLSARAMACALWPVTWGYFLQQLLDPLVPLAAVDAARAFYLACVRGRGPLPCFRVGATPYGLLPVSSLARWQAAREAGGASAFLPGLLRQLLPHWTAGAGAVPRVGGGDPDQALIDVLTMDASAREVWIRPLLGNDATSNMTAFLEVDWPARAARQATLAGQLQGLWGGGARLPRVLGAVFQDDAARFRFPLVADTPSETARLDFDYLGWIRTATLADLRAEKLPPGVARPTSLLYRLARHATLLEYGRAALDVLDGLGLLQPGERREPELVGIVPGTEARKTIWDRLEAPLPGVTGTAALGDHLGASALRLATPSTRRLAAPAAARPPAIAPTAATARLGEQHDALGTLQALPTAELERLLGETLDTCAHRLDAWITALASERLASLRAARPTGVHLGAFAWVEDLRPVAAAATRPLPGGGAAAVQPGNGGYIHAPSMGQAAAAAVLRNGYLSRSGPGQERYALDCSSARVREARALMAAMRGGQSVRAVLGYQFERGLHERELEEYIEPFRRLYPLPEADRPPPSGATTGLSPRDVVDALALRDDATAGRVPFGTDPDLPSQDPDLAGVKAEIDRLDQTFDAISDLLTAEAVFHLVRGTTMGASASLDAQAEGVRPPDPDFIKFPRGGIPLTHRVALLLGGDPAADAWPGVATTARAAAEPFLDRWLAALAGNPATVQCRVHREGAADAPVALSQLGLRPLDLLSFADGTSAAGDAPVSVDAGAAAGALVEGSDLDRRVVIAALGWAPPPGALQIVYAPDPAWAAQGIRSFPEILELLRAARDVIGRARPLRGPDLAPAEAGAAGAGDPLTAEADGRATLALGVLGQARGALATELAVVHEPGPGDPEPDLTNLRAALIAASAYGAASFPPLPLLDAASERRRLVALAGAALGALERREAAATAAVGAGPKMEAIFGAGFVFLPRFLPAAPPDLQAALDYGPALIPDASAKPRWLQQAQRVRAPLGAWGRLALYARCLGGVAPSFDVAQIPHVDGARWVGLPFAADEAPPARRTSLVLLGPARPKAVDPWVGLWVDEWNETIPSTTESTGVAFNYDDPGAEAAQVVLLAVCPTNQAHWDVPSLEATLLETLDLARIRAVHADVPADLAVGGLSNLAQLLPAIYLATNPAGDTIGTDLTGTRVQQAVIAAAVE